MVHAGPVPEGPVDGDGGVTRPPPRRPILGPDRLVAIGFALLALVAYQAVAARYPVEWDGAQLVMGLDRFDVTSSTPHPPGYWLYIAAGRTLRALTPLDGTASLTLVSSLAAAATVGLVNALGRSTGGRLVGVVAASLVLTSPFVWFYAASVDTYTLDALAGVVLLTLAWHARPGSRHGVAAAAVLGLAAGFRQTSLLLFAPLVVVAMARSARSVRTWAAGAAVGSVAILAWLMPMLAEQPGGFGAWRAASDELLAGSVEQTSIFTGTTEVVARNMTQGSTYTLVAFLPAVVVATSIALARLVERRTLRRAPRPALVGTATTAPGSGPHGAAQRPWWARAGVLAALGALPALTFLVLIHFGKAGYVLAALPAGVVALTLPARRLRRPGRRLVAAVVALVCLVSAERFLVAPGILPVASVDATPVFLTTSVNGAPFRFTRQAMADNDRVVGAIPVLADRLDPASDVVVWGWLNGGERYRHATLLLPQFTNSFVRNSVHLHTARRYRWTTDPDVELEVPPGGRAVFVLDHIPPDLQALLDQGLATPVATSPGLRAWAVEPGVTLLGVAVVEGDTSVPGGGNAPPPED